MLKSKYRPQSPPPLFAVSASKPVAKPVIVSSPVVLPGTLPAVYLPKSLIARWTQFVRPPMTWNRMGTMHGVDRCVEPLPVKIVTTIDEWIANPGSRCRPNESQLERLGTY